MSSHRYLVRTRQGGEVAWTVEINTSDLTNAMSWYHTRAERMNGPGAEAQLVDSWSGDIVRAMFNTGEGHHAGQ
jgi:hypothetical protein